jgi:predicted TIM-barrel fold metal-dependent hydrolase
LHPEEQVWLRDGTLDWLWPAAEKEGLPVSCMGGLFLSEFRAIAEAHPNLKMILDHCGLVRTGRDEAAFAKLDELVALAKLPNVAVKATGAPHYSTEPYPYRNIQDGLHRIFDAFGPKRFFWGTDITRMPCTYRQCVTFFTEELPWLRGEDLEWVMGRGVCAWLGWNLRFD